MRGHPALQHPGNRRAHDGHAKQFADPRIVCQQDAERGENKQPRRIHRVVARPHVDVESLEVLPRIRRGIGESTGGECLCPKQIAELVVNLRRGHGDQRQQRQTQHDYHKPRRKHRSHPAAARVPPRGFHAHAGSPAFQQRNCQQQGENPEQCLQPPYVGARVKVSPVEQTQKRKKFRVRHEAGSRISRRTETNIREFKVWQGVSFRMARDSSADHG